MLPKRNVNGKNGQDGAGGNQRSGRGAEAALKDKQELMKKLNEASEQSGKILNALQDEMVNVSQMVASCMQLYRETYDLVVQQMQAQQNQAPDEPVQQDLQAAEGVVECAICANRNAQHAAFWDACRDHDYCL